jgi:hypothetical protein
MHLLLQPLFTAQKSSSLWNHSRDLWVAEPNFAPKLNKEKHWRLADELEDQWSQSRSKWALDPCHKKSEAVWDLLYHEASKQVKDAHLHTTSLLWSTIFHLLLISSHRITNCELVVSRLWLLWLAVSSLGSLGTQSLVPAVLCSCQLRILPSGNLMDGSCDVCVRKSFFLDEILSTSEIKN